MGSPPPTRGTPACKKFSQIFVRITPAYAGNTLSCFHCYSSIKDHPRLRGEHGYVIRFTRNHEGSPPPTRGTPPPGIYASNVHRITPAYAGNTGGSIVRACVYWDHPRLRGEHLRLYIQTGVTLGSPPPTRGTQIFWIAGIHVFRITPAYAGNTTI